MKSIWNGVWLAFTISIAGSGSAPANGESPILTVTVDTGKYCGEWFIESTEKSRIKPPRYNECKKIVHNDNSTHYFGSCQVSLTAGEYKLAMHGNHGLNPDFRLLENGLVSPINESDKKIIQTKYAKISMNTTVVNIDAGGFGGRFGFEYIYRYPISGIDIKDCLGSLSLSIPMDFSYQMTPFGTWIHSHGATLFSDHPERIEAKPNKNLIVFRTASVSIVPMADNRSEWKLEGIRDQFVSGPEKFRVVKNMPMSLTLKNDRSLNFRISEDCQPEPDMLDFGADGAFDLRGSC